MIKFTINKMVTGVFFFSALLLASCGDGDKTPEDGMTYFTMEGGDLIRPTGYRTWVYIGTPVTPNELNGGKAAFPEMHNVYIDPVSYKHYKKTGEFPEGTILVKELTSVGATEAVSGKGYFEGEFIGLEASLKSKEHYPNEPGNWAIFSFTNPTTGILKDKATAFPAADCNSCHEANADDDFVFTQYYPVLRAAKAVGAGVNPEDAAKRTASSMEKVVGIWDPTAPSPESVDGLALDEKELFAWLQSGEYKKWENQEKGQHASLGPHETVRAFVNDKLAASLNAGNENHPVGSIAVKEQYKDGESFGWAVMVKSQDDSAGGDGWFWYEVLSDQDVTKKAAWGNGVKGCVSCHLSGNDMVKIEFPFN